MDSNPFCVVWEISCYRKDPDPLPVSGDVVPEKFLVVDFGDDADFYCDFCGSQSNHMPAFDISDKTRWKIGMKENERTCVFCNGTGKRPSAFKPKTLVDCHHCQGKGIQKFDHSRKLVGRVYMNDLRELAAKNPQGWR